MQYLLIKYHGLRDYIQLNFERGTEVEAYKLIMCIGSKYETFH